METTRMTSSPSSSRTTRAGSRCRHRVQRRRPARPAGGITRRTTDDRVPGSTGLHGSLLMDDGNRRWVALTAAAGPARPGRRWRRGRPAPASSGHRHVLVAGGVPGKLDRPLDPVGDEGERRATLALQDLAVAMRDDEHASPERRVVTPGGLALEHAPAP